MENNPVVLQKVKNRVTIWTGNSNPVIYPEEIKLYIQMFITVLLIAKSRNNPSVQQWMNRYAKSYNEYYSVIKRNKVTIHATTQKNPKNIVLIKDASHKEQLFV